MICEYDDSDNEEYNKDQNEKKGRSKSLTKRDVQKLELFPGLNSTPNRSSKNTINLMSTPCSQDSSFSKEANLINEDIMKLINGEDEPIKKRNKSPSETYSKKRLLTKLNTVKVHSKLEISCSSEIKSPVLGKNYILKPNIHSMKFHTPSSNSNTNPLLNYYKNQNISPLSRNTMSASNDDGKISPLRSSQNLLDEISFPLDDNFNKLNINDEENNFFSNSKKSILNSDGNNLLPLFYFDDSLKQKQKQKQKKNQNDVDPNEQSEIFGRGIHEQMQQQIQKKQFQPQQHVQIQQQTQAQTQAQIQTQTQAQSQTQTQAQVQAQSQLHAQQQFNQFQQDQSLNQFFTNKSQQGSKLNNLYSLCESNNQMNNINPLSSEDLNYKFPNSKAQMLHNFGNKFQNNPIIPQNVNGPNLSEGFPFPQNKSSKKKIVNKNFSDNSNDELIDKARMIASEQNGCRFIQKKIESEPELGNPIFESLEKDLLSLSCDSFGNYLLQKLLSVIDDEKIERFVDIITPFFVKVSVSSHGTRVVQKLLDSIKEDPSLMTKITGVINNNLIELATDSNSNHIIIKYVTVVCYPMNMPVYDTVIQNFMKISKDKFGCCVMQKCIELGSQEQKQSLIYLSLQNSAGLITDQYGNYVLQFIVNLRNQEIISAIIKLVISNLRKYCTQKFSSNVIEKCLDSSCQELQMTLINAIVQNEGLVADLIIDLFGNYIIQKILLLTNGKAYYSLLQTIAKNSDKIKRVSFGNKVLSKLMNLHKDLCFMINSQSMNQMMPQMGMNQGYFQPQLGQLGYNLNMPNQTSGLMDFQPQMKGFYDMRCNQNIGMPANYPNNSNYFKNQFGNTQDNIGNIKRHKGMK